MKNLFLIVILVFAFVAVNAANRNDRDAEHLIITNLSV